MMAEKEVLASFGLRDVDALNGLVERVQRQIDAVSRFEVPPTPCACSDPMPLTPSEARLLSRGIRVYGFGSKIDTQKFLLPNKPLDLLEQRLSNDRQKSVKQWFALEDEYLASLVEKHGFQWTLIQTMLPHKTKGQLRRRWKQIENNKNIVPGRNPATQKMCESARNAAAMLARSIIPYQQQPEEPVREDEFEELSSSDDDDDDNDTAIVFPVVATTTADGMRAFVDEDDFFRKIVRPAATTPPS